MDRDWMPTTQSIERVSGRSQEQKFSMQRQGDKSAILARIQQQRLRKPKNQGRMSLTSRPYRECLFHTRRQAGLDSQRPEASGFGRNFSNPDERW